MLKFLKKFIGYFKGERRVIAKNNNMQLVKVKPSKDGEFGLLHLYTDEELTPQEIAAIIKQNIGSILEDDKECNNLN